MNELPESYREQIFMEVKQLRKMPGKQSLTIEVNTDISNNVNSIKIKTYTEKEVRL